MRRLLLASSLLLLAACSTTPPIPSAGTSSAPERAEPATPSLPNEKPTGSSEKPAENLAAYTPTSWEDLPGWSSAGVTALQAGWTAWLSGCERLKWRKNLTGLCADSRVLGATPDLAALRSFYEKNFQPWQIKGTQSGETGLITGYYEALLNGSLSFAPGRVPLYAEPDDLLIVELGELFPELKGKRVRGRLQGKKVIPYWSRDEINQGKGPSTDKVLAWANDPIDAFFMEVQGSGRVELEDGTRIRLAYANQNGQPYRSIGRWLADQGEIPIEQVSMQRIQAWAKANPERLPELLAQNPSYVFFRQIPDDDRGAIGALNVPLTAEGSIAVDPKFTPLGSSVWLSTTRPYSDEPLQRLVQAQDTGGAIRGPVRADFFWGFGHEAGAQAGKMKQKGQMWLLLPINHLPPGMASPDTDSANVSNPSS